MALAIRIYKTGAPDVLTLEDVPVGEPGRGEARVRNKACGLNYIDIYHRTGLHHLSLPSGIGMEGAGVVEAVGPEVTWVKPGDRVAYPWGPVGAYSEVRVMPADHLVILPDVISFELAAGVMMRGTTAQFLVKRTYKVAAQDTVLVHAAAGGVGLILCQWAKSLGAKVIGTVGSDEKAALAKSHGCDDVIVYTRENFVERVRDITSGAGVSVVYDSVGKDTFIGSLDCLRPLGMMVNFGSASGPIPPLDPSALTSRGSLFFTRAALSHYTAKRHDLIASAEDLFRVLLSGEVKAEVRQRYALKNVVQAHRDLEQRKTSGSSVLIP